MGGNEQTAGEFPNDDACSGAHVEGVLRSILRYLDATIGGIDHFLMDAFHFVTKNYGVFGGVRN